MEVSISAQLWVSPCRTAENQQIQGYRTLGCSEPLWEVPCRSEPKARGLPKDGDAIRPWSPSFPPSCPREGTGGGCGLSGGLHPHPPASGGRPLPARERWTSAPLSPNGGLASCPRPEHRDTAGSSTLRVVGTVPCASRRPNPEKEGAERVLAQPDGKPGSVPFGLDLTPPGEYSVPVPALHGDPGRVSGRH